MKRVIAFVLALLSGSVAASSNVSWIVSSRDYQGFPLLTRHPVGLNFDKLQVIYPIRLIVDLTFAKVQENGLPENHYNETLEIFDNFITEYFKHRSNGQCVLVETYGGKRHFYLYVSRLADTEAFKIEISEKFPQHQVEFDVRPDENWSLIRKYSHEILSDISRDANAAESYIAPKFPNDENGNVLRELQNKGLDFSIPQKADFFAVFKTKEMAARVATQFMSDSFSYGDIVVIETRPAKSGGIELEIGVKMLLTHENVSNFEKRFAERVSHEDGYLDGWGVLVNP